MDTIHFDKLTKWFSGTFLTSGRPSDFKAILQWLQRPVSINGIQGQLFFHERTVGGYTGKSYNQQVISFQKTEDGVLMRHYDIKQFVSKDFLDLTTEDLELMAEMDIKLSWNGEFWYGQIFFTNEDYLSRFVQQGYSAFVRIEIHSDTIYYHLKIFDKYDDHIYGPKNQGYTLKLQK